MKRLPILFAGAAVAAGLVVAIAVGGSILWGGSRAVRSAEEKVRAEQEFRFSVQALVPALNPGFEPVSSPQVFLQAALFQDHLYIAGPSGLLEYSPEGSLLRRYAAGAELPASPLIALAPAVLADSGEPELVIATAEHGLLAFNGRSFRQILP